MDEKPLIACALILKTLVIEILGVEFAETFKTANGRYSLSKEFGRASYELIVRMEPFVFKLSFPANGTVRFAKNSIGSRPPNATVMTDGEQQDVLARMPVWERDLRTFLEGTAIDSAPLATIGDAGGVRKEASPPTLGDVKPKAPPPDRQDRGLDTLA